MATELMVPEERSAAVLHAAAQSREQVVSRRNTNWAENVVGVAVLLVLCYYGREVLAVIMFSILLTFILAPVVDALVYVRIPRALAAALTLVALFIVLGATVYFSFNQTQTFFQTLPKYSTKIRDRMMKFRKQAESFEALDPQPKGVISVRPATDWTEVATRGFGSLSQIFLAASFIPFLVYFMLTSQHHVRSATVMLFPIENRQTAYTTLGLISAMIRSFMVGNLIIGVLLGIASSVVFAIMGLPFFYIVGFLSGFLSLIPYLGVPAAMAPPLFVAVGHLHAEEFLYIGGTVLGMHLFALNVLYPKMLGNRLQLNPLAVTISLLVWGFLWGAVGLLLAVPMTAAMKIIFDHVENLKPYGAWLGE